MRRSFVILLLIASVPPSHSETLTVKDGTVYEGVTVEAEEDGLALTSDSGVVKIPAEALTDEQIKQYHIDWRKVVSGLRGKPGGSKAVPASSPPALAASTPTPEPRQTRAPQPSATPIPQLSPSPTLADRTKAFSLRPEYTRLGIDARSQGRKGTCTVFGTVGVIEFHYAKRGNPVELSEQFAAWAANKATGSHRRDGFNEKAVIAGIKEFGISKEELMPYKLSSGGGVPTKEAKEDAEKRRSISVTWIQDEAAPGAMNGFSEQVISAICGSIADGDPVTLAMKWPNTSRLGKEAVIGMRNEKGRSPGHIVVAIGYETDAKWPGGGRMEIRNSWGQAWADAGYAWVTFEFLKDNGFSAFAVRAY
ncbi:MAG: C1 family peptidase [Terrimicrobiaceae bacterium]